jgi:rod shape-determining protein MreD
MFNRITGNIIRFVLLVFVQVTILNNIHLHGLFNPYIYPLFILLLPLEMAPWLLIFIGFFTGLVIDFYSNTLGMHAAATTLLAFLRPYIINLLKPAAGYQPEDKPTISSMGFFWFITYASFLVLTHHLVLFMIETLSFRQFLFVISKIAVSTVISISLMVILQYLFYRRRVKSTF